MPAGRAASSATTHDTHNAQTHTHTHPQLHDFWAGGTSIPFGTYDTHTHNALTHTHTHPHSCRHRFCAASSATRQAGASWPCLGTPHHPHPPCAVPPLRAGVPARLRQHPQVCLWIPFRSLPARPNLPLKTRWLCPYLKFPLSLSNPTNQPPPYTLCTCAFRHNPHGPPHAPLQNPPTCTQCSHLHTSPQ